MYMEPYEFEWRMVKAQILDFAGRLDEAKEGFSSIFQWINSILELFKHAFLIIFYFFFHFSIAIPPFPFSMFWGKIMC